MKMLDKTFVDAVKNVELSKEPQLCKDLEYLFTEIIWMMGFFYPNVHVQSTQRMLLQLCAMASLAISRACLGSEVGIRVEPGKEGLVIRLV